MYAPLTMPPLLCFPKKKRPKSPVAIKATLLKPPLYRVSQNNSGPKVVNPIQVPATKLQPPEKRDMMRTGWPKKM